MTLVPAGPTPEEYAKAAQQEHDLCLKAGESFVMHAIRCGEALNHAYELVGHGEWLPWLDEHVPGIPRAAVCRYRRIAFYRPEVERQGATSLSQATAAITGLPRLPTVKSRPPAIPPAMVPTLKQLHNSGLSHREIAAQFGVNPSTITLTLNPKLRRKYTEAARSKRQRKARALKLLAEKEERTDRERLAKQAGKDVENTYGYLRNAAALLQRLVDASRDDSASAFREALAHVHRAEDEIVRALKNRRVAS